MINLIIFIVTICIYYLLFIQSNESKGNKKSPIALAKRVKGIGIASYMDFPTVNVQFNKPIYNNLKCGVYQINTSYGIGYMYVDCNGLKEIHFLSLYEEIAVNDIIEVYDVTELDKNKYKIAKNGILGTYYNGCEHCFSKSN